MRPTSPLLRSQYAVQDGRKLKVRSLSRPPPRSGNFAWQYFNDFTDETLGGHSRWARRLFASAPVVLGVGAVVGLGAYVATLGSMFGFYGGAYTHDKGACSCCTGRVVMTEQERLGVFDEISPRYESMVNRDEWVMGLKYLRWRLMRWAKGDVLEVGAGTGMNLRYYPAKAGGRVTLTDGVDGMVAQLKAKAGGHFPDPERFQVMQMDAGKLAFDDASFDTVLDTFGLCSFEDPVGALREMQRVCRPQGKILLLEHGQATWAWLIRRLENGAVQHAKDYGCIWNKPIADYIRESGLVVEKHKRWHFGSTYYYVCRPSAQQKQRKRVMWTDTRGEFTHARVAAA